MVGYNLFSKQVKMKCIYECTASPTYDNSLTISENGHIIIDTTTRSTSKKL